MTLHILEEDVKSYFEKLIAKIKSGLHPDQHSAVDEAVATIPKPEAFTPITTKEEKEN